MSDVIQQLKALTPMYNYAVAYMYIQYQYAPSKTKIPTPKTDNPTLCRPSGPTNDQVHVLHSLAMTASVNPVRVPLPPMSLVFTSGDPLLMTSNTALTILHPPNNLGLIFGIVLLLRPPPKQFIILVLKSLIRSFVDALLAVSVHSTVDAGSASETSHKQVLGTT